MENAVLQMLETWLSNERLLSNSTPRFLTDEEELTEYVLQGSSFLEWEACWGVGKVRSQHCQIAVTFSSLPDQLGDNSCVVSLLTLQEELHHTLGDNTLSLGDNSLINFNSFGHTSPEAALEFESEYEEVERQSI